jgi:hypothetical protein
MKTMTLKLLVAGAAFAFGSAAYADCAYPKAPDAVPDGKTATEEQMVKAMHELKDYNTAMTEYLGCVDKDAESRVSAVNVSGPEAPKEIAQIKAIQNQKHNAAVDELTQHANSFNEQVHVFKARKSG